MMSRILTILSIILIGNGQLFSQENRKVSFESELEKLATFNHLPAYENASIFQYSSYDTTGNNDDGFSGKYSFIRKENDSALVIFEAKGKGVINRIWTPTPTDDIIDFYFGNNSKPSYSIKFSDLFSGKLPPFVSPLSGNQVGGYFCYVPIPFSDGCKMVFRGKQLQFYQVQYKSLPASASVATFNGKVSENESALLKKIHTTWIKTPKKGQSFLDASVKKIKTDKILQPGQSLPIVEINSGGRILGLELHQAHLFEGLHKQLDLKITWDFEKNPAIHAPIQDVFGYAFGNISMQSLLAGTSENSNYLYFPMPFDRHAKVEIMYRKLADSAKQEPIRIQSEVYYTNLKRNKSTEGKFYGYWNKNINPPSGKPHLFLEGTGKGHYVGTILQSQGLRPGMTLFFEGDDSTVIDNKLVIHGTGSEDYFNGGWYALMDRWDQKMSLPLHGSLDYSLPMARTGGYRLFISDKMPFKKSIHHSIEHGPEGNNFPVDYTSMAYYYAPEPLQINNVPANKLSVVYLPDTMIIYPQLMKYTLGGDFSIHGNRITANNSGMLRIDLSDIPQGRYKLLADADTGPQGSTINIWQRQTMKTGDVSFHNTQPKHVPELSLGNIEVDDFSNAVTFQFKNSGEKKSITIRRLILIKQE